MHKDLANLYNWKNEYPMRVQNFLCGSYEIHTQETVTKIAGCWLDVYYKGRTFEVTWSLD
jgi:hypothetical protein